ncbi:MAG: Benzoate--CoA ligase [Pseudomonadota bacterium]
MAQFHTQSLAPSSHLDTFTRDRLPPQDQWPVFVFDRPEVQYPEQLNCVQGLLDDHVANGQGDRIAVRGKDANGDICWTYSQLQAKVNQIAHVLIQDMGMKSGQRLLLRGGNSPMMAACFLAALKAGLVVVPTMPLLRAAELKQIVDKAQISAALCDSLLAEELGYCTDSAHAQHANALKQVLWFRSEEAEGVEARMVKHAATFKAHPTSRDDVCLIAFTSGTTGQPKGTMHFHRDVLAMCDLFISAPCLKNGRQRHRLRDAAHCLHVWFRWIVGISLALRCLCCAARKVHTRIFVASRWAIRCNAVLHSAHHVPSNGHAGSRKA